MDDSSIISSEGEEGQERTPEMNEESLENLLHLCCVTRAEDKFKIRLAADIELIYHHLPLEYYLKYTVFSLSYKHMWYDSILSSFSI